MNIKLPFFTLLLMISFASVNAVLFTPALPDISRYFHITEDVAQLTITWFLIGYAVGQLLYGPIANRFGRKPALYIGISLQIVSSLLCVYASYIHQFSFLIVGRLLLALGSGVGLKMTFTMLNECYKPKEASQKIAYLMMAFAITPGLGVALGGVLTTHFGWPSCFYASAVYGLILLLFVSKLPETLAVKDVNALKFKNLIEDYCVQFKNKVLISGGMLMGSSTSFVYVFAALAPFLAIDMLGMNTSEYGLANLLPPIGMLSGSLVAARLSKTYALTWCVKMGIAIASFGTLIMIIAILLKLSPILSLFVPLIFIYFGLCFVMSNSSVIAMNNVHDKAHASAVMSFINMGLPTVIVLCLGLFSIKLALLPSIYVILCLLMIGIYYRGIKPNVDL